MSLGMPPPPRSPPPYMTVGETTSGELHLKQVRVSDFGKPRLHRAHDLRAEAPHHGTKRRGAGAGSQGGGGPGSAAAMLGSHGQLGGISGPHPAGRISWLRDAAGLGCVQPLGRRRHCVCVFEYVVLACVCDLHTQGSCGRVFCRCLGRNPCLPGLQTLGVCQMAVPELRLATHLEHALFSRKAKVQRRTS